MLQTSGWRAMAGARRHGRQEHLIDAHAPSICSNRIRLTQVGHLRTDQGPSIIRCTHISNYTGYTLLACTPRPHSCICTPRELKLRSFSRRPERSYGHTYIWYSFSRPRPRLTEQ